MGVILIAGDCYSGEQRLAETLAVTLGYRRITEEVVVEKAAAGGSSHRELWMTLRCGPGWRDRFLHKHRRYWIFLQAALAEEIETGWAVCHGVLADFLVQEKLPAVRIRIKAPRGRRVENALRALALSEEEADAFLDMQAEVRRRRLRYLYGREDVDPSAYDLTIDLERMDIEQALAAITALVAEHPAPSEEQTALHDFVLACQVRAALANDPGTGHLELRAAADGGRVFLEGTLPHPCVAEEVRHVAFLVPGVTHVNLDGLWLREPEACHIGPPALLPRAPSFRIPKRLALAAGALAAVLAVAFYPFARGNTFRGIQTS